MSGIVGIGYRVSHCLEGEANQNKHMAVMRAMQSKIRHRGGEHCRIWLGEQAVFGQCVTGKETANYGNMGDTPYGLAWEGDIFNEAELKENLRQKGYRGKFQTTEELVVGLYEVYGEEFLCRINGTFALALWDGVCHRLLLARDRIGAVPLFYTLLDDAVVFGSEIKALFAHPRVKAKVDIDSFRQILGIGPARIPGSGVFCDVFDIKPGYYGVFDAHGFCTKCYWEIPAHPHKDSYGETVEKVRFLVEDAIQRQASTHKPICSLLSGGIDSSIVTAITQQVMEQKGDILSTYSFAFRGSKTHFVPNAFQPSLDNPFVDMMVEHLHTNHTYLECDELGLVHLLESATSARDLPGMADVDASLLYFCGCVQKNHSLAMTGECADEVFGGYPWFYRESLLLGEGFPWSKDMTPRTAFLQDDLVKRLALNDYAHEEYKKALADVPYLEGESPIDAKRREVGYLSMRWFMCTLLDRMDRMGMGCGLSARVPFADYRIIAYVYNVPWEMKYKNGVEKHLLRDAMGYVLPTEVRERKKSPYPKTYHPGYEAKVKEELLNVLNNPASPIHSIVDKRKITPTLTDPAYYGSPWYGQLMATPQLWAYYLQINQWLTLYQPEISLY